MIIDFFRNQTPSQMEATCYSLLSVVWELVLTRCCPLLPCPQTPQTLVFCLLQGRATLRDPDCEEFEGVLKLVLQHYGLLGSTLPLPRLSSSSMILFTTSTAGEELLFSLLQHNTVVVSQCAQRRTPICPDLWSSYEFMFPSSVEFLLTSLALGFRELPCSSSLFSLIRPPKCHSACAGRTTASASFLCAARLQPAGPTSKKRKRKLEKLPQPHHGPSPSPLLVCKRKELSQKMDDLEILLYRVRSTTHYRNSHPMAWSCHVGWGTTFEFGASGFQTPHNIRTPPHCHLGVNLTPVDKKKSYRKWQRDLYWAATGVFCFVDPAFVAKQHVIHFSKKSNSTHVVPKHLDSRDIGPQLLLYLGKWKGATLCCYSNSNLRSVSSQYFLFDQGRQVLRFDGRLVHEVREDHFQGVRFTVICYQLYHEGKTKSENIMFPPKLVH